MMGQFPTYVDKIILQVDDPQVLADFLAIHIESPLVN